MIFPHAPADHATTDVGRKALCAARQDRVSLKTLDKRRQLAEMPRPNARQTATSRRPRYARSRGFTKV